jgi:hypothetical protein
MFYLLWGFNYRQIALQERLGFELDLVTPEDVEQEFRRASSDLTKAAKSLQPDQLADPFIKEAPVSDGDLRYEVEEVLAELGLPNKGHVQVRQLYPKGFLLRWSTAGIYIPQACDEGHIDAALLSVQKPFTIAHEMAHGYGVTDEGACNFIAWLACRKSRDEWIRFGGAFTYWRYAAAEMQDSIVKVKMQEFDPVIIRSLELIRENDSKYPDLLPRLRDAIYSNYLKQHGVRGGLRSYNYVVMMVSQYLQRAEEG